MLQEEGEGEEEKGGGKGGEGEENTISFPTHRHSLSIMENLS